MSYRNCGFVIHRHILCLFWVINKKTIFARLRPWWWTYSTCAHRRGLGSSLFSVTMETQPLPTNQEVERRFQTASCHCVCISVLFERTCAYVCVLLLYKYNARRLVRVKLSVLISLLSLLLQRHARTHKHVRRNSFGSRRSEVFIWLTAILRVSLFTKALAKRNTHRWKGKMC